MTGIILLAAGSGTRFIAAGGEGNKLNAILSQTAENPATVFETTLNQLIASGLPVHVVTRAENMQVQASCARQEVSFTLTDSAGTGESIAAGVRDTPQWDGWLIHLADMPFVTAEVFATVAAGLSQAQIVRPCWQNEPGHPVGFARPMRERLLQLRGDHGARELLRDRDVLRLNLNNPAVIADIDLPEQLRDPPLFQNGQLHAAS
ncbi:nucleotidyltransferase family protein [Rahnella woolbedingensis]|uniref:Nucleotidyltransferase family protein n=1 Tax=Rahnella woolbedingensis TaxID=1510574 RepID=A0A419N2Q2_9GAMM|nr:nucleotidyltransferase family protein [Rahnella woolbedingensis]RJT34376.1 nucleotidyltransferase family protein [Rahnella woolbedingensis]